MFSRSPHRKSWKTGSFPRPGHYHAEENICLLDESLADEIKFPDVHVGIRDDLLYLFEGKPLVALAPGGAKNVLADDCLRRWPIESYVELINRFSDKGIGVVVTGSSSDQWVVPYLPKGVHNCIGQLDLLELLAVLKNSSRRFTFFLSFSIASISSSQRCPICGTTAKPPSR